MNVVVLFDEDDVRIWPVCQVEDCGTDVRQVTFQEDYVGSRYVSAPCGHVQTDPDRLVWVVRELEADCGV